MDSTEAKVLLSKVKNGVASNEEIDELIDIVEAYPKGAKLLVEIKNFENKLVTDVNKQLASLEEMENEYIEIAHKDEAEQNLKYSDMKKRYKKHVSKAEELIDAIKIAYFQIDEFKQYENRLYKAKEPLTFHE